MLKLISKMSLIVKVKCGIMTRRFNVCGFDCVYIEHPQEDGELCEIYIQQSALTALKHGHR